MVKGEAGKRCALIGDWMLRLATAATFIVHGVEAIRLNPAFIDLLIGSAGNLLWMSLSESTATILLYAIGIIDIVLAILLLCTRWRWIPWYLALWGFITACSRITAAGLIGLASAYPETLIRVANGGVPLAIAILCCAATTAGKSPTSSSKTSPHSEDSHHDV